MVGSPLPPIWAQPASQTTPYNYNFQPSPYASLADILTGLSTGLLGQGPSSTPISPFSGFGAGVQNATQLLAQRQAQNQNAQRMGLERARFGMEQQQLQTQQDEQKRQRDLQAQQQSAISDWVTTQPADKQALYKAFPDQAAKAYFDTQAKTPNIEHIRRGAQDVSGYMDAQGQWHDISSGPAFAPPAPKESYKTVTGDEAKSMGLDPTGVYSVGSNGSVSLVQQPKATQYGAVVTGDDAKKLGFDPAGVYQQGPDGKWVAIQSPQKPATTFKTVTGPDAQSLGLDPAKTWSIGSDGSAKIVDKPAAAAGGVITGDAAKSLGLDPTGTYQQRPDGTYAVLVKPRAEGTFGGNALDAQDSNIILKGQSDDAFRQTPEYAMAWNRQYQQPKLQTTQDPNDPTKQIIQAVIVPPPAGFKAPVGVVPAQASPGSPQAPGAPAAPSTGPAGSAVPTAVPIPGTSSQKQLNAEQSLSKGFAERMKISDEIINKFASAGTSVVKSMEAGVPIIGNFIKGADRQQLDQAAQNFINAQLRRESGAAISQSELDTARKQYIPQPGDSPELLAQKAANRQQVIQGMEQNASPYPLPDQPATPSKEDLKKKYGLQ